ncbi:hypothetical protein LSM04_009701 [Trypanosoma melophagium]|uniref:uncharacterized protein n=1 Tax=Trypanosoma melophagium TaxID=715481 RepID=UPI00351A2D52|nr:hypothetical protein LSM04_009701 [Trypanosoma melophagium]
MRGAGAYADNSPPPVLISPRSAHRKRYTQLAGSSRGATPSQERRQLGQDSATHRASSPELPEGTTAA